VLDWSCCGGFVVSGSFAMGIVSCSLHIPKHTPDEDNVPVDRDKPRGGTVGISDSERQDLESGRSYLAAFGITGYTEQFGSHWTKYCFWQPYSTNPGLVFVASDCVKFNSVGEGAVREVAPAIGPK
jgi:hypothetical protein